MTITEYMGKIKMLADELSLIQQPMSNKDLIGCVLDGLNLDYDVVVNNVQTMVNPPAFEDLYHLLLNREKRLEVYHKICSPRSTALCTTNNCGHGRSNRGRGHGSTSQRGGNSGSNRGSNSNKSSLDSNEEIRNYPPIICQICNKSGLSALKCRQRHNFSYQPDDLPTTFSAMNFPTEVDESTWFSDTSATKSNDCRCFRHDQLLRI